MKKIFLSLIFGALWVTACQEDTIATDNIAPAESTEVTFDVDLDSEPLSRSTQEPAPNRFIMELYQLSAEGAEIPANEEPIATLNEGSGSFATSLDANAHYAALFWADYTETGGYNGYNVEDLRRVRIDKEVSAPAYSGSVRFTYDPKAEAKPYLHNVLTHAVAQVNFIQTKAIEEAQNRLAITFPTTYSLNVDGSVATEIANTTTINSFTCYTSFNEAAADQTIYTCYVIAESEYANTMDLSYLFNNNAEQTIAAVELQRNYCTNVSGDFSDPKEPEIDPTQCITINEKPKGILGAAMATEYVSTMIQLSPVIENDVLLANVTEYAGVPDYTYFADIISNKSQNWDLDLSATPPALAEDEYFQIQVYKPCEYSACEFDNCNLNYYTLSVGNMGDVSTIGASYSEHNSINGAETIPLTITSGTLKMSYVGKQLTLSIDVVCEGGHSFGVEYSGTPATKVPKVGDDHNGLGQIWKISEDGTRAWLWKFFPSDDFMGTDNDLDYAQTSDRECGMTNMQTAWAKDNNYTYHHPFNMIHKENLILDPDFDGATYAAGLKNAYYIPAIDEYIEFLLTNIIDPFADYYNAIWLLTSTKGDEPYLTYYSPWGNLEKEYAVPIDYDGFDWRDVIGFMEIEL